MQIAPLEGALWVEKAAVPRLEVLDDLGDRHFDVTRLDSCGWKGKGAADKFEKQLRDKISLTAQ